MNHGNLNSEIIRLRRGLAVPFTPAEAALQARRDTEVPRGRAPAPVSDTARAAGEREAAP